MASGEKCFTFTWKLENVSFCLVGKDEPIYSPDFVVDSIDETKWYLGLNLRGKEGHENYVHFYLFISECNIAEVSVKFELGFLAEDGSVLTSWMKDEFDFLLNTGCGWADFEKRENVFITKRSAFLPHDTLTARCRIWKIDQEMFEDVRCFARTRIGVERRSFLWNVKNFSTFEYARIYQYDILSSDHDKQLLSIDLYLSEGLGSELIIYFKVHCHEQLIRFSTLLLSLIDVSGNRIECNREEFCFDEGSKFKEFKFSFTKNKLMVMKRLYLQDDTLSLYWEWAFPRGIVSEEIEEIQYTSPSSENIFHNAQNVNSEKILPLSYPLNDNLKSLHDENFLCDVELKTSSCTFNAHKVILSASSTVFKAMFSTDMKEKDSNCVSIEDLSDDTIRRMLSYIYTARIEDLTWERASLLYVAADKYAIFSLKDICSSYITDNLSPSNACEILLLSDLHADDDLKSAVQNYVLKHLKDTVNSDGWKLLMKTNPTLAAETLSLPYK